MSTKEPNGSKSDEHECPACGRDDFKTPAGMKLHHTKIHDESIAGVESECSHCGDSIRVSPSRIELYDRSFCDASCQGEWRAENRSGEKSFSWDGGNVSVECAYCGTPKQVKPAIERMYTRHFCDNNCRTSWVSENRFGPNSPQWDQVRGTCDQCGATITRRQARFEQAERHFCDNGCKFKWYSDNWNGEANPAWKGGEIRRYETSWPEQQKKTLRRDEYTCVACGDGVDELGQNPDVHHITPFRKFDDHEKANQLSNLVTLCRSCHFKWEGIPLRPQ